MKKDDRVVLQDQRGSIMIPVLGTVKKITPAGYTHISWDDGSRGVFSPVTACEKLKIADGEDAIPRHVWKSRRSGGDPASKGSYEMITSCDTCGIEQDDENEFGPCVGCDCMDCSIAGEATH